MKKIIFALAAVAVLFGAASCEKDNLGKIKESKTVDNPLNNITVTIGTDSKLAIDDETLTPAFEIDDVIFGWDSEGTAYAYTCTEVTEDAATFTRTSSGAPSADEGTVVNLVYAPGYEIEDIVDKTLDVNLAVQGETLPVIMHTSGTVDEEGICKVTFLNDVAIVDVKDAVLPDAVEDEEYTVSFHGKNTSLKFTLNEDGSLIVAPASEGPISSSEKAKVSADSKISKKFAVPASIEATDVIIAAMAADGSTYTFSAGSKEIAAGKYITVADKTFAPQYVAQIGSDKYTSLAKAVAVANVATENVTIELLEDIVIPAYVEINNVNSAVTTLDLNGCVITCDDVDRTIYATSDLIVNDTKGDGGIKASHCAIRANKAKLTINGGTFEGDGYVSGGCGLIYSFGEGSKLTINGGEIKCVCGENEGRAINVTLDSFIYGGTISCEGAGFALRQYTAGTCTVDGDNVVIYSNSTYASPVSAPSTNSRINFVNGYVFADSDKDIINNASRVAVTGGHFNKEVTAAEGYECVASPVTGPDGRSYTHTVQVSATPVATVTIGGVETGYPVFADALTAAIAADEATLKLMDECEIPAEDVTVSKKLTLDLNGYKLVASAKKRLTVDAEGAVLTITDNSTDKNGIIDMTSTGGYFVIVVTKGNCIVNEGTIQSTTAGQTVRVAVDGSFEMNGGSIINKGSSRYISGSAYNPAALQIRGGKATINGGTLYCLNKYAVSLTTEAGKLNIHGGTFVADSLGSYSIYTTTSNKAHKVEIDNSVSEPVFVGAGTADSKPENAGRVFYNGYTVATITTKAGLFTGECLGKNTAPETYLAEGYKRVTGLDVKKTIFGKEYTFIMQVVKKDE